jgi:hypothetical protein
MKYLKHAMCAAVIATSLSSASAKPKAKPIVEPPTMSCAEAYKSKNVTDVMEKVHGQLISVIQSKKDELLTRVSA